jgi:hypothetical protein
VHITTRMFRGISLSKIVAALPFAVFSLFSSAVAFAVDAPEPPLQDNTLGVVAFAVITVVCFVAFGWYMYKNEKKNEKEKTGDKF